METIYDFTTGKVNKQNRQRKTFINTMAFCMQQFSSSSVEVNELINWLFCMSDDQNYYPIDEVDDIDYSTQPVKHIDENKIMKEIYVGDLHLYSYALLLHDYVYSQENDVLSDIIHNLFMKLDEIVHPYEDKQRDLEDIKYFVELDYEPKEQ